MLRKGTGPKKMKEKALLGLEAADRCGQMAPKASEIPLFPCVSSVLEARCARSFAARSGRRSRTGFSLKETVVDGLSCFTWVRKDEPFEARDQKEAESVSRSL